MSATFSAALGNRMIPDGMIGYEPVTRAVRLLLARDLNAEIAAQSARWAAADLELQAAGFDEGVGQVDLEQIPNSHLHEGPHTSLLESPPEAFPNVSMMAYQHVASPVQFFDQLDAHNLTLFVEIMVKAGPVPDGHETEFETIVHRRIQRTTEAVNSVIRRDGTIMGTVLPQQTPAVGGIGRQAWIGKQKGEVGQRYMWHGSRLQYTLQRVSTPG